MSIACPKKFKIFEEFYGDNAKKYATCEEGQIKYKSLDELCDRFPGDYANLMKLVIPVIINYLGKDSESSVIETVQNIRIEETQKNESNVEALHRLGASKFDNDCCIVNKSAINTSTGIFYANPIIEESQGEYQIAGKVNIILVQPLQYTYSKVDTFVHELLHAIKSQHEQYQLLYDKNGEQYLRSRSGLIQRLYSISTDGNNNIDTALQREANIGIEEGINTYDEMNVMDLLMSIPIDDIPERCRYIVKGVRENNEHSKSDYYVLASISKHLLQNDAMRKRIRNAQLYGEYMQCQSYFNSVVGENSGNSWQTLNYKMDCMLSYIYKQFNYLWEYKDDLEKINKLNEEGIALAQDIANILSGFVNGLNHSNDERTD